MRLNSVSYAAIATAAAMFVATSAFAATIPVDIYDTTTSVTAAGVTVSTGNAVGEQGGGGSTAITNAAPRGASGTTGANGSLEIHGDRSRYVIGSIYETSNQIVKLDDLKSLSFDWQVGTDGSIQPHGTPAVRLQIMDNGIRSEMTWEGVYNGGVSGVDVLTGVWNTADPDSLYYVNVRDHDAAAFLAQNSGVSGLGVDSGDQGVVLINGAQQNKTITDWNSFFSSNAYITGLSFGAGSNIGSDFVGYIDNVRLGVTGGTEIALNFETAAAVPEPATWAMMIGGFGLIGGMMRRRRSLTTATATA